MTMNPTKENWAEQAVFIERLLDLAELVKNKSYFLFGPRQTGKTSLIRHSLPRVRFYDLLDASVY